MKESKGNETVLRAARNLFARMIIMAESRQLQMQEVLCHPLGPLPASLATSNGLPRETNRAQLGRELEKLVQPTVVVPSPSAYLIDGMSLIQKLKVDHLTFGEIARYKDIGKIASAIGLQVCKALLGLHAFTGCDSVSSFAGIGKVKPLKIL